jgi:hypothetical protein
MTDSVKGWIAYAGVLAGITYGVLRLAYIQFYFVIGVRPEEVGLGKTEILTQALVGPLTIASLTSLAMMAILLSAMCLTERSSPATVLRSHRRDILLYLGMVIVVTLTVVLAGLYLSGVEASRSLRSKGETLTAMYIPMGVVAVPVLEVQALPVRITWKDEEKEPKAFKESNGNCFVYLGQSNSTAVAYNVKSGSTLQFPISDTILRVDSFSEYLSSECTPSHILQL